jgi:ribonuclease R
MVRKKTGRLHRRDKFHHRNRKKERTTPDNNFFRHILASIYQGEKSLSISDLLASMKLPRSSRLSMEKWVEELCRRGDIKKSSNKTFSLGSNLRLVEATIEKNPRGFGFASDLFFRKNKKIFTKDPFISAAKMASARHGDRVLIKLINIRRDGRPEAEVIHILRRGKSQLAGFYKSDQNYGVVYPEDRRYPSSITISQPLKEPVQDGDAVIVKMSEQQGSSGGLTGEVVKVLGDPASVAVQTELVVDKFSLANTFSPETEKESLTTKPTPGPEEREDLRELLHITIDGEDAKDFDDAVCIEKKRNGFRLWVSIADVGAYVRPGSRLDLEAYERGTSVYFPGTVIPMLPENLSNNLCSLLPNKDRLAVTVVLDFDRSANLKHKRILRSIIRSRQRFTYDIVKDIIIDKDPAMRKAHKALLTPLKWASELARALRAKRMERGSIRFSIPAAAISLNPDGTVNSITRTETHFAHQMIEEFMLAANEAVADTFIEAARKTLFRVHEKPDPEKVSDFVQFAATLGFTLSHSEKNPAWFNEVIDKAAGSPHKYIINNLLLRTMQQARYSADNLGHFGLAADNYLHFTSPIRRYPDLVVHRQICHLMDGAPSARQIKGKRSSPVPLQEAGQALSARERTAISAERDMEDRLKRQFMSTQIGKTFNAVISGVSDSSLYVELIDTFVSGVIRLSTMVEDYYLFDEKRHRVVGDISGATFQIGQSLIVELVEVDNLSNKIYFKRCAAAS